MDFIDKSDGCVVFRTCDKEKDKVVVQLGTCDAQRALTVAKLMYNPSMWFYFILVYENKCFLAKMM